MARGKPKTPARRQATSPGLKSPLTPGWTSAKASMFLSPKSVSPAVSRRMTRRSSVYQKKTSTASLTGRKSPAVAKTAATKEVVIGEVEFRAPVSKSKRTSVLSTKKTTSTSPALTRSRRSSVYQAAGKKLASPPKFQSPPKVKKLAPKKKQEVSPKKSSTKRRSASPTKAPPAKVSKVTKEESTEATKIPKPASKSPSKKKSPKKVQKKTPKQVVTSPETPRARSTRRNKSPSKSPTKKPSPKKPASKKQPTKVPAAGNTDDQVLNKSSDATKIPKPSRSAEKKSPAKKRNRSPAKSPKKRSPSKSPAKKPKSASKSKKIESPKSTPAVVTTPQTKQTPRSRSSRTPLANKSATKATPASSNKNSSRKPQTPSVAKRIVVTPKASPVVKTPARVKLSAKATPARAKSPADKTPVVSKSAVKKTPANKTPSRGKSPARKTPSRKIVEIAVKSAKKEVTFSPLKSTPRSAKTDLKRMPTPYVKSPTSRTPSKAVKVLGITPRSAKELKEKKKQRNVGRTPPRTSTPMGDRKRQAVFDPEVSTIRVKRTRKSTGTVNAIPIAEEDTMTQLNVNNNADDSAIKPSGGWFGYCTIL